VIEEDWGEGERKMLAYHSFWGDGTDYGTRLKEGRK